MNRLAAACLAPSGVLRAAFNYGNPVLAQKNTSTGEPRGISVDLANELARRLAVPLAYRTFDAAGKVFAAIGEDLWDIAFLAIDSERATQVLFTAPYCVIDGTYMVHADSQFQSIDDVDRLGVRVTVARGSAYDLFLSRTLKRATILRASTGKEAIEWFLRDGFEVAAGVKGPLAEIAERDASLRVIDGRFMSIRQAMAIPRSRDAGWNFLCGFVEEMKASGFVARGLERSGQFDAVVADCNPAHQS